MKSTKIYRYTEYAADPIDLACSDCEVHEIPVVKDMTEEQFREYYEKELQYDETSFEQFLEDGIESESVKTVWVLEDDGDRYEFSLEELADNITREYAREILNDEDYDKFCKVWDANLAKYVRKTTGYYPGCYGDALDDC